MPVSAEGKKSHAWPELPDPEQLHDVNISIFFRGCSPSLLEFLITASLWVMEERSRSVLLFTLCDTESYRER